MRKCKKIAILVIVFILSTVLNVYAEDNSTPEGETTGTAEVSLATSSETVKKGDTVSITISAKCSTGVSEMDSVIEYDTTKLKLKKLEYHEYYSSLSGKDEETQEQHITIFYGDEFDTAPEEIPTEVSELVKLNFEVLDTVTVNEILSIRLSKIELIDDTENIMTVENPEIKLTVVEDKPTGDGNSDGGNPDGGNPDGGNPDGGNPNPDAGKPKDPTTAGKPMNNAGLVTIVPVAVAGILILAGVLYTKCRKYKDVK